MIIEKELLDYFLEFINIPYAIMIIIGSEVFKLFLKKEDGKWHFFWDKEKHIRFNVRLPIFIFSLGYSVPFFIVYGFDNTELMFSLITTFGLANTTYTYFLQHLRKKIIGEK